MTGQLQWWQVRPGGHKAALWCNGRLYAWTHGEKGVREVLAPSLEHARQGAIGADTLWIADAGSDWREVLGLVQQGAARPVGRKEIIGAVIPREQGRGELVAQLVPFWDRAGAARQAQLGPVDAQARVIIRGLFLAADLLGVRLRYTPSYTGRLAMLATLKASHFAQRGGVLDMAQEWKDRIAALAARDTGPFTPQMHYARQVREDEQPGQARVTLQSYDRNMSYVCCAGEVPTGEPVEVCAFMPGQLGAYKVNAQAPDTWPRALPGYIGIRTESAYGAWPREVCSAWAWSHQIRAAIAQGWEVEVLEGFAWPREQKHALLKPWSENVWQARQRARELRGKHGAAAQMAEGIIKAAGVAAIGRLKQAKSHAVISSAQAREKGARVLSMAVDDQGEWTGLLEAFFDRSPDPLYQPAWWASTLSLATERLVHGCLQAGDSLLSAYVDGILATAPVPALDGSAAQRGGWRHVGQFVYRREELQGAPGSIIWNLNNNGGVDDGEE